MNARLFLDPVDTLAIGDGRPFNQEDTGRAVARSLFPPPPDTLYGAARVACARALGWDGRGGWPPEITRVLGSWDTLGSFAIAGPFFRSKTDGDLLPIPAHVMLRESDSGRRLIRLAPSRQPIMTDLGPIRLPVPPEGDGTLIPLTGRWARAEAVLRLLAGEDVATEELGQPRPAPGAAPPSLLCHPAQALPGWGADDLARPEHRVGIARDHASAKARDGMLYASVRRALPRDIEIFVECTGFDGAFDGEIAVQLGGEARFAFVRRDDAATPLPAPASVPSGNYLVWLATPALMLPPAVGEPVAGLPGRLLSAVIPSVSAHNGRPGGTRAQARPVLPAGTVLFMEGGEGDGSAALPERIGDGAHLGYGRYTIGEWT